MTADQGQFEFFLVVMSIYILRKDKQSLAKKVCIIFFSSLFLGFAIGNSQIAASIWAVLAIISIMKNLFDSDNQKRYDYRNLIYYVIVGILGVLIYFLGIFVTKKVTGIGMNDYNDYGNALKWTFKSFFATILLTYKDFFTWFFIKIPYTNVHFRNFLRIINVCIFLWTFIFYIWTFVKNRSRYKVFDIIFFFLCVLILPFAANLTDFFAKGLHMYELTTYPFYFLYLVPIIIYPLQNIILKKVLSFSFLILLCNNIIFANIVHCETKINYDATQSAMNRILYEIEKTDGYIPGVTPVMFIGNLKNNPILKRDYNMLHSKLIHCSMGRLSVTYVNTYYNFLSYVLAANINSSLTWTAWGDISEFEEKYYDELKNMKNYPSDECCKLIDGILFVRLSDDKYFNDMKFSDEAILPNYKADDVKISFHFDEWVSKNDFSTNMRGWAWFLNYNCRVFIEADGKYYQTEVEKREDVQKAFNLDNDEKGFTAILPICISKGYIVLVDDDNEMIYRVPIQKNNM